MGLLNFQKFYLTVCFLEMSLVWFSVFLHLCHWIPTCCSDLCDAQSLILAPFYPQHRSLIFGMYGGLAVLVTMGWTFMALVLSHCIILYSVALVKKKWMCFAAGLSTLASIKLEPYNSWQVNFTNAVGSFAMNCGCWRLCVQFPFQIPFGRVVKTDTDVTLTLAGGVGDWLFWSARCPVLWRLWLQHHALYELCFRELWEEGWQLHILWSAKVQLLPPILLFWSNHDFWPLPCPGEVSILTPEDNFSVRFGKLFVNQTMLNGTSEVWSTDWWFCTGKQHSAYS